MKIQTTGFNRRIDVELDGATFTFKAMTVATRGSCLFVLAEYRQANGDVLRLSKAARDEVQRIMVEHLVDWHGVTDERGEVAFTIDIFVGSFTWETMLALFFAFWKASQPTETERKNLSTGSNTDGPRPATFIATDAES